MFDVSAKMKIIQHLAYTTKVTQRITLLLYVICMIAMIAYKALRIVFFLSVPFRKCVKNILFTCNSCTHKVYMKILLLCSMATNGRECMVK